MITHTNWDSQCTIMCLNYKSKGYERSMPQNRRFLALVTKIGRVVAQIQINNSLS
jgi:hypothetical protein